MNKQQKIELSYLLDFLVEYFLGKWTIEQVDKLKKTKEYKEGRKI